MSGFPALKMQMTWHDLLPCPHFTNLFMHPSHRLLPPLQNFPLQPLAIFLVRSEHQQTSSYKTFNLSLVCSLPSEQMLGNCPCLCMNRPYPNHSLISHFSSFFFDKTSKFMLIFSVKSSPYSHVKNLIIQWIFIRACIRKIFVIPSQILLFTM